MSLDQIVTYGGWAVFIIVGAACVAAVARFPIMCATRPGLAERALANVRPEIHDEVAYALDLAASERPA